jgi:hypothetical protein
MSFLARTCLPVVLLLGAAILPSEVEARGFEVCKKKAKKKRAVKRSKVTAATIAKWQKQKLSPDEIVEKATAAGYVVTKSEKAKLKRLKVKPLVITKLEMSKKDAPAPAVAAPAKKKDPEFNLDRTINPNDIDFDSVPPPNGMPAEYARKQKAEQEQKKLDTSMRPSAPFEEDGSDAKKNDSGKRVVFAAKK